MSCWCGHGPWHHHGYLYAYPPPGAHELPSTMFYPSGGPPRRRRRRADAEELADYLAELEAEVASIRRELDDLRKPDTRGN